MKISNLFNLTSYFILLNCCLILQVHASWFDKSVVPQTIPVSKMPSWKGDTRELLWLTSFDSKSSHDGPLPNDRIGAVPTSAIMHPYRITNNYYGNALPLPGGWEVMPTSKTGCLEHEFTLYRPTDNKHATWIVKKDRHANFVSRRLGCIGGGATVYFGVVVNSRFFAFATAEPGWIFFDRKKGEFLPFVVQDNPNFSTHLYVDRAGQILIEIQPGTYISEANLKSTQQDQGIRKIVFNGESLIGLWNPRDLQEVINANDFSACVSQLISKSYDEEWRKQKAKNPQVNKISIENVDSSYCKK